MYYWVFQEKSKELKEKSFFWMFKGIRRLSVGAENRKGLVNRRRLISLGGGGGGVGVGVGGGGDFTERV